MNLNRRLVTLSLMLCAALLPTLSGAATVNLVRGVVGPVSSNVSWANYSIFNLIPGSAVFPTTSSTTVFYLGFTAGSKADIGNMVVYTTARGSLKISKVTPVTYGGTSVPSINLGSASVCAVAPSSSKPCIVRFDPTSLSLSPASDYYFVIFFKNDSNNGSIGAAQSSPGQSSLVGEYLGGADYTRLAVGESIPSVPNGSTDFLMYVMND
jgi:hypothetical protein